MAVKRVSREAGSGNEIDGRLALNTLIFFVFETSVWKVIPKLKLYIQVILYQVKTRFYVKKNRTHSELKPLH